MNKFRVKLHSVFFLENGDLSAQKEEYYTSTEHKEKQKLDQEVQQQTEGLTEQVQEQEFPNVAGEVAAKISSKYTDMDQLRTDRKRFQERVKNKNSRNEVYGDVWTKKITQGFGFLITSLKENGYFKNKNEEEETAKIKELYTDEVYSQYERNIWSAGNKTFNSVKDSIFGSDSNDYPANKIYTQLTGAAGISKVDRTYVEGYESEILDWVDTDEKNENMSDRQNRNFLSDDLPQYLWNIRKTPGIVNALKWLPIFSVKEDRPSKVDRKAIKQFLKTSSKIEVEGNKDKAVALMEVFHDSSLNTNSGEEDYKLVLAKFGIKVEDKNLDDIIKAGSFYINTQRTDNDVRDQHAIYLSVLKIIESEGSVDAAVKKFQSIVEQGKKDKKEEKKEGYESGEKLGAINPELYEFAKKLGITDFASATRLSEKNAEYFWNTPVEKILANLNNDRVIDARDTIAGGSKTGSQFLEIFNQVGKEKALSNLVEYAKLLNKTMGVGLPEQLLDAKTIEEDIKGGHTGLILLLQNVISKPGEDLYTLLSGHPENPFEGIDLEKEDAASKKYAAEMIKKMNLEALKKDGLSLPTPESMQSGLATALYTEYKRGIGLGGKVSFDQWVKGVEMNTGFQVRDDGTVMVGVGLNYRKKINLGKGWSTTPELSAGAFIPLGMGKPELSGSVGLNDEVAKERITKKGIKEHLGVQGGITLMPAGVIVLSAGFDWGENKLEGIEPAEQIKMVEFRDNIISPILDRVYEERKQIKTPTATKLDFNDPSLVKSVKSAILAKAIDEKVPGDKREMVIDATMRLLINYNGADLSQEGVKDIIAQGVAEQYAMAWAEDRKAHITDKAYLSGANLGVFWVVGSPLVGIYAGVKITKHDLDGYGDEWGREQEMSSEYQGEWNQEMLDRFNQQLGLSGDKQIKLEGGHVVIPASLRYRVNVNEKMYGLMMKDKNGNILLHTQTPMSADIRRGAAMQGSEVIIGGDKGGQYVKLDTVGPDRFVDDEINQDEVLKLGEGLNGYSSEVLNKALVALKSKFPKGDPIQSMELTDEKIADLIGKLNALDKSKKAKIAIVPNEEGKLEPKDPVEGEEGRGLEIEYRARFEMIDSKAKEIADAVYAEALKVKDPRALNAVKHQPWKEYGGFNIAMQSKDYSKARDAIKPIFAKLDQQIKGANFTEIGNKLDEITDNNALGQALMSINNIFARSKKVRGGGENYEFKGRNKFGKEVPVSMGTIIAEREGQISDTIKKYEGKNITPEVKAGYQSLIEASAKYRKESKIFDGKTSAEAASLKNTVGFNLGDKTNPENPLFNPEIYNPMVDMKDLEKCGFAGEQKDALHKRAMELFANNEALINPILKYLGLEGEKVRIQGFEINGEKGKLTLDIGGKKITLSAGMKFGYFTQCVNHTVILDDISAETEDGTTVIFNSGVWENGRYVEGNKSTILSTTEVGVSGSVIVHDGTKKPEGGGNEDVKSDKDDEGGKSVDSNTNTNDDPDQEIVTPPTVTDDEDTSVTESDEL